ncbi:hypothetical protein HPB48_022918 [Haemaphysalis longicornis]|uniref:Reverse transcriptase domain-containing protein n=1 Tax=Haemaphysalis longicornis TaxID=44386 RepID=A0A9J6FPI3_HAELO|nr:hypothetical protein HPB48_022918 [Haemaphysalis longicornis]
MYAAPAKKAILKDTTWLRIKDCTLVGDAGGQERLQGWAEAKGVLGELQVGFWPRRRLEYNLFVLTQCIEVAQQARSPLYVAFLDISKAYDCVDQQILWSILQDLGLESNDIALLRALYSGVTAQVEWDGHVTAPVSVSCALRQGCPLSPVLFMLYVAGLTQRLESSGLRYALQHHEEGQLVAWRFPALVYADDFVVLAGSPGQLQQLLDMCGTEMTRLTEAEV